MSAPSERHERQTPDLSELNMADFLSPLYTPQTTYADWAKIVDFGNQVVDVTYVVKDYHCDPAKKPILRGEITVEGDKTTNRFMVNGTEGHFRPETRIEIYQAHLADGAMIATATHDNPSLWLVSIQNIAHSQPGLPGDGVVVTITKPQESRKRNPDEGFRGVVSCNDRVHTRGFDLRFEEGPLVDEQDFFLPQHALFEIGAQAAAGVIKKLRPDLFEGNEQDETIKQNRAIVYSSKGASQFEKVVIGPRDVITSRGVLRRITTVQIQDMMADAAYVDIAMSTQRGHLATIGNLGLGFLPSGKLRAGIEALKRTS